MIESFRGLLLVKQPHRVVCETHGVAFEFLIPFSTFKGLPEPGETAHLLCHLHWREEGPQLFGFLQEQERTLFRLLNKVNKIGPKLAVNVMSACTPEKLVEMILCEDVKGLTSLKGVGPKLASRLVLELKDTVAKLGFGIPVGGEALIGQKPIIPFEADVREALENLGYTSREIDKAFKEVVGKIPPEADVQYVLEAVLRNFSRP